MSENYSVTNFQWYSWEIFIIKFQHPGGLDVIMEYAGRDATVAFMDKGHSKDAWMLLTDFFIGDMVKVSHRAVQVVFLHD